MRGGRIAGLGLSLVTAAALTSCVRVPDHGAITEAKQPVRAEPVQPAYKNPPPPKAGADPVDIVSGFLDAMTATPLQTTTAQEFLSTQAQAQWRPDRVMTYTDHAPARGTRNVVVRLQKADQVGLRAQWQGPVSRSARRLAFPMVQENGQWRIAHAPDALIVPLTFFDQNFQSAQIYFFDPTGRILVPEVVHVPQGQQFASAVVRALVRGPAKSPSGIERSFLPPGLAPGPVPVGDNGVAEVTLGPDPGPLNSQTTQKILAQIAWTLRQDASIRAFTLTIAGHTVTDASGVSTFPVNGSAFDRYDPAYDKASGQAYALKKGRLVSGQLGHLSAVQGPFGETAQGIGPFAVNLAGSQVAGVTPDALLLGRVLPGPPPVQLLSGPGLLRPAWDFANRLWEIQNGLHGATVHDVIRGKVNQVHMPGISGERVRCFLVSRDGSRIVAVLHGPKADHIVTSRIRYDNHGRAKGATRAQDIRWTSPGTSRIRDIGWTSPTTIAVLDQVSRVHAEVRILNVDGSTAPAETPPTLISGRVKALATSPLAAQTPYAVLQDTLYDISQIGLPRPIPNLGLHFLTYAG
jgi:hypothetical protein